MNTVLLTKHQLDILAHLIKRHQQQGMYWGRKDYHDKAVQGILDALRAATAEGAHQ